MCKYADVRMKYATEAPFSTRHCEERSNLRAGQSTNLYTKATLQPLIGNHKIYWQVHQGAEIASNPAASSQARNDVNNK